MILTFISSLILLSSAHVLASSEAIYAEIVSKFHEGQDEISYSDLENKKCVVLREANPNLPLRMIIHVFPDGEIWKKQSEAYTVPGTPELVTYPHGPLFPPVVIPAKPEVHVPAQNEILIGKVFLEVDGAKGNKRRAFWSELAQTKIILRSKEIGRQFESRNNSWYDWNFETVIKKSGPFLFFMKRNWFQSVRQYNHVGYCWE